MSQLIPKRLSLASQVAEIIREGMMSGVWSDWLPGERVMCERLKVSRPTLRAALNKLEKEGWLRTDSTRRRRILRATQAGRQITNVVGLLTPLPLYAVPPLTLFCIDELRDHLIEAGYRLEIHYGERFYRENPGKSLAELV